MSDLISRQRVIKSIDKFIPADPMKNEYTQGISVGLAIATRCVEEFSQENDDSSQVLVKDLINRQDAIDVLETIGYDFSDSGLSEIELEEVCEAVGDVRQDMIRMIKRLPFAQPEIIRCKDCKHWNTGNCNCPDIRVDCSDYYVGDLVTEEDFYCGFSKRRKE